MLQVSNSSRVMETGTIQKNEASLKSLMSREIFLRKVCFAALTIVLSFGCVSCGKDDDRDSSSSSLTGTWKAVSYEAFDGMNHFSGTNVEYAIIVFNNNGMGICTMDDGAKGDFNWELKGDLLSISSQYFNAVWKVIKLTTEEIIVDVWYDPEDTTGSYQYITYVKEIAPPDNSTGRNLLAGTWVLTSAKGYCELFGSQNHYEYSFEVSDNVNKQVFKSDGTFVEYESSGEYDGGEPWNFGTWTYEEGELTLNGNNSLNKYDVKKMTSKELVCEGSFKGSPFNGCNGYSTRTFTKIK